MHRCRMCGSKAVIEVDIQGYVSFLCEEHGRYYTAVLDSVKRIEEPARSGFPWGWVIFLLLWAACVLAVIL